MANENNLINTLFSFLSPEKSVSIFAPEIPANKSNEFVSLFDGEIIPFQKPNASPTTEKALLTFEQSPVAVIDLGRGGRVTSAMERKPDVRLLRNYAENSVWVRAAIDYYRRTAGRSHFELIPLDSTIKATRNDKFVKKEIEKVLAHPNEADSSYAEMKEQLIEDYLVVGHGCLELDLFNDLTVRGVRPLDAARIGFLKAWDGTDTNVPRYVEFDAKTPNKIKRFLAHQQVMCLVNRPRSYSRLGFSHVEALHYAVMALLSGDEFLIKQIEQPVVSSLVDLGEGANKQQVDDFKYQLQQVKDQLAVIGGTKNTKVHRLAATADEMQILDGAVWFVRQVAAVFGMSTAKLKLAVDTSRANTETMMDDDIEAITGELTRIEELEAATFIKRFGYLSDINLQFFYPIMHRKDERQQAQIARIQTNQPWASPNEARMRTGEKPLDEKDYPYANEILINTKDGPLPFSVFTKKIQEFEKNIGKVPETQPDSETTPLEDVEIDQ